MDSTSRLRPTEPTFWNDDTDYRSRTTKPTPTLRLSLPMPWTRKLTSSRSNQFDRPETTQNSRKQSSSWNPNNVDVICVRLRSPPTTRKKISCIQIKRQTNSTSNELMKQEESITHPYTIMALSSISDEHIQLEEQIKVLLPENNNQITWSCREDHHYAFLEASISI